MLGKLREGVKQKGQGIVEYALLLAFVVALAMILSGGNLGGAVKDTFDNVVAVLTGEKTDAYVTAFAKWSKAKRDDFTPETSAERLAADQQALINIANFFFGKERNVVEAAVGGNTATSNLLLVQLNDEIKYDNSVFIRTATNDANKDKTDGRVFNWMQGDYGTVSKDENGNTIITGYDDSKSFRSISDDERIAGRTDYNFAQKDYSSTRYLYSDYAIYNQTGWHEGKDSQGNDIYNAQNGIKVNLTYDTSEPDKSKQKVTKVEVVVNSNSNNANADPGYNNSRGLKVTVEQGKDPVRQK